LAETRLEISDARRRNRSRRKLPVGNVFVKNLVGAAMNITVTGIL
jgi:hypothetical protein